MISKKHFIRTEAVLLICLMLFSVLYGHPVKAEDPPDNVPAAEETTAVDTPEQESLETDSASDAEVPITAETLPKEPENLPTTEEVLPAEEAPIENTAVSEASPAANGVTEVSTLDALIAGLASGDVKLTDNIYGVTDTITIPAEHVLDGNGKTISAFTDASETAENFTMPADHSLCEMIAVEGTLKNTAIVAPRSAGMGTPYYEPQSDVRPANYRYDHIAAVHVKGDGALQQSSVKYGKYGVRLSGNAQVSDVWVQQAGQAAFYVYADTPLTGNAPSIRPTLTDVHVKTETSATDVDYKYGVGIYIEPKTEYSSKSITWKGQAHKYTQRREYQDYVKNVKMSIANYKSYSWASEDEVVTSLKAAAGSKEIETLEKFGADKGMGTPQLQAMIRGDGGNPLKLSDDFRHSADKKINIGAIWFDKKFIGISPIWSGVAIPFDNIEQSLATKRGDGLINSWELRYTNITTQTWSVTQQYPNLEAIEMTGGPYQDQIVSTFQAYGRSYGFDVAFHYVGASKANNPTAFDAYYAETQPANFNPVITSTVN